jgi:hypothetical protein
MAVPTGPVPDPQANRTDLLTPGPTGTPPGQGQPNGQPVQVPTGTPYGEASQLQQAQQAVPLPKTPQVPAPGGAPQPVDMGAALAAAKAHVPPNLGKLTRPTERPHEPVTAGLPGGPPPQAGTAAPQRQVGSLSSMISAVAAVSGSAALSQLAARAAGFGQ